MILKTVELAKMSNEDMRLCQIDRWADNNEIGAIERQSMIKMVEQWTKTGCPLTFGEAAE